MNYLVKAVMMQEPTIVRRNRRVKGPAMGDIRVTI